ncbi:hypothetical protein RRG08_007301 [Elysia crispata]|uniref:Uncharacterized protein n=1 Tax=Elysia crispata TaxID=231223 RepID=A0AAE1E657_9GAST|nr:hypothetical protein RRG08_007301 [Elysia crispata]
MITWSEALCHQAGYQSVSRTRNLREQVIHREKSAGLTGFTFGSRFEVCVERADVLSLPRVPAPVFPSRASPQSPLCPLGRHRDVCFLKSPYPIKSFFSALIFRLIRRKGLVLTGSRIDSLSDCCFGFYRSIGCFKKSSEIRMVN